MRAARGGGVVRRTPISPRKVFNTLSMLAFRSGQDQSEDACDFAGLAAMVPEMRSRRVLDKHGQPPGGRPVFSPPLNDRAGFEPPDYALSHRALRTRPRRNRGRSRTRNRIRPTAPAPVAGTGCGPSLVATAVGFPAARPKLVPACPRSAVWRDGAGSQPGRLVPGPRAMRSHSRR